MMHVDSAKGGLALYRCRRTRPSGWRRKPGLVTLHASRPLSLCIISPLLAFAKRLAEAAATVGAAAAGVALDPNDAISAHKQLTVAFISNCA